MTLEEIKLRQLTNQYLIKPNVIEKVVKDLCGIQAQFMANALHSLRIRCNECNESDFGENLIKNWTIRGTVHILTAEKIILKMYGMIEAFGIREKIGI